MHLVYTRSYWHGLCRDVLGRELHHGPTSGGAEEDGKFADWYGKTLSSYRKLFGSVPPPDIWPDPEKRFTNAGTGRWVDSHAFWLIPKPTLVRKLLGK